MSDRILVATKKNYRQRLSFFPQKSGVSSGLLDPARLFEFCCPEKPA